MPKKGGGKKDKGDGGGGGGAGGRGKKGAQDRKGEEAGGDVPLEEGTDPVAPSNVRVEAVEGGAAGGNNDEGAAPSTRGSGEPAEKCSSNEGDGGEIKGGDGEGAHQEVGSKADDSEANDGGTKVEAPVPSADAASKTDEASGTGGKKDAKQSDEASGSKGRRASGTVLRNDQECFLADYTVAASGGGEAKLSLFEEPVRAWIARELVDMDEDVSLAIRSGPGKSEAEVGVLTAIDDALILGTKGTWALLGGDPPRYVMAYSPDGTPLLRQKPRAITSATAAKLIGSIASSAWSFLKSAADSGPDLDDPPARPAAAPAAGAPNDGGGSKPVPVPATKASGGGGAGGWGFGGLVSSISASASSIASNVVSAGAEAHKGAAEEPSKFPRGVVGDGPDATGGKETGGKETGGKETGGKETGGKETGGKETGGKETGGKETGGKETGGKETGGKETGGKETGGKETGGKETGGKEAGSKEKQDGCVSAEEVSNKLAAEIDERFSKDVEMEEGGMASVRYVSQGISMLELSLGWIKTTATASIAEVSSKIDQQRVDHLVDQAWHGVKEGVSVSSKTLSTASQAAQQAAHQTASGLKDKISTGTKLVSTALAGDQGKTEAQRPNLKLGGVMGIQLSGALLPRVPMPDEDSDPLLQEELESIKPLPWAIKAIATLVEERFQDDVFLIAVASAGVQARMLRWLAVHHVYEQTGLTRDRVHLCREEEELVDVCRELGLSHMIEVSNKGAEMLKGAVDHVVLLGGGAVCPILEGSEGSMEEKHSEEFQAWWDAVVKHLLPLKADEAANDATPVSDAPPGADDADAHES